MFWKLLGTVVPPERSSQPLEPQGEMQMTTHTAETPPLIEIPLIVTRARVVGFLFLSLIPLQIFGANYVPSRLVVPGDAAATARNIMASRRPK